MANRPFRPDAQSHSWRCRTRFAAICVFAVLAAAAVSAQTVPTGVQEYYVLGWEQHIWDMMDRVQNAQGGAQFADGMNSVVTATASADNQVIYYDHWEDGPDGELANFPNVNPALLQTTTLVIGDDDDTNGELCQFNTNATCGSDIVFSGDYVNFNSDQGLGGALTCGPGVAGAEFCSVPLNDRDPADIRFDGGDLIETSGGPLTLIHSQYPLDNFIGGSIEILSRQAVEAARSYSVPIGEDLYTANTVTEPFHYVELELVAFEDTSITIDSPGAGSVSFDLARGEHWSSMGFIDDNVFPALGLTINAGTKVSTTAPISGMVFTGGDGTWATRNYTLLPDILHSTDYVSTAPGDVPTAGPTTNGTPQNRPANVYILNPDLFTAINVSIVDSSGSYTVNIPANSMRSMDDIGAGRNIAANSTVRMTSDRNFWGVTAYDYNTNISDWGHSWLAKKFLTTFYTVSFGPGNQNQPPDTSQYANAVFVAATADRTRVQFDLDNDGTYDPVDLNGDGNADAAPYADNTYEVDMLSALKVIDPTDNDMTGARILANKPVAVSWGQDTDRSYYSDQALDTGFTVYPVNQLFLDPALTIDKEVDTSVVPTGSSPTERTVTYTLTVKSYGFGPLTNVEVWDLLPTGVYGDTDYVGGSTLITCPNLVQGTANPAFADCSGGPGVDCGRLTWDIDGACGTDFELGTDDELTVRYQVVIPVAPGGTPRQLTNEAHAQAELGSSVFSPFDTARVVQTDVTLTKSVDVTTPAPGDVITFTLQVANTSTTVPEETAVFITDPIPADTTYSSGSVNITNDPGGYWSANFDLAQNAVVWNAPSFPAGTSATLSFQVTVNPTVPAGTEIPNRGGYESVETPYFLSNEVEPVVQGPALAAVKSIVGNPTVVHPSENVTFQIRIDNTGTAAAENLLLSDPFPLNAAYVAGSMSWSLNSGPFTALSDSNDGVEASGADGRVFADRLEFRLASLGASQDVRLRFRVIVDPGTVGEFLSNQGTYASDETPSTDTNLVQVPIVGDTEVDGHVFLDLDGDGTQDLGEPDIPNVDVVVTDPTGAVQRVTTDANGDYTATVLVLSSPLGCYRDGVANVAYNGSDGSLTWTPTWQEYGVGADTNTGTDPMSVQNDPLVGASNNALRIRGVSPRGGDRGLTRQADLNPGNSATLAFRYHRRGLEDIDIMNLEVNYGSGFVLLDTFGQPPGGGSNQNDATWLTASYTLDATQLPADPVTLRWRSSSGYDYATDMFYLDDVELCVSDVTDADVTLNVDESDPDFPSGATLTTANDPQTVTAIPGGTVSADDVGYQQSAILFTKTSDAEDHEVSAGQTLTYSLEFTNNTGVTQTGIVLTDAAPTGTTYVAGSSQVDFLTAPIEVRVSANSDDAEEDVPGGGIDLNSTDLELVFDGNQQQYAGMRFLNLAIPQGASIASAELEFETDETDTGTTNVVIYGQDADDAATFTATNSNISSRPATTASVAWSIPAWSTTSEKHVTPDLSSIIQEIVDRPLWASGNDMVLIVAAGTGCTSSTCQRTAESYDGEAAAAALLRVNFEPATEAAGDLPALLDGTEGYTLGPGATMVVTFQVLVNDPLNGSITEITNTAYLETDQEPQVEASVTDVVVELGVVVEYDNAGFDVPGATVTYFHEVVNTGSTDDSYAITLDSELDWLVELIDPSTGAVIATDSTGDLDSLWDNGVTINTGTLAPGEAAQYKLRVTIPGGATEGVSESTSLIATSQRVASVFAQATDETYTVTAPLEPVILLPDNSGVAEIGGTAVYSHRILNNTGFPDTFDLSGWSENGWGFTFYWDTDGNGIYTDGVDVAITNTLQLADGASQLFFVEVAVPGSGVQDNTVDVVHIGAVSRNNVWNDAEQKWDVYNSSSATDTTTVTPPTILDLSGGGTRTVDGGQTAVFPGTLRNLTGLEDTYNLSISEAWFNGFDAFDHPTELWVDTTGNGVPDSRIAVDDEGDGVWDSANDTDGDIFGLPDVTVAAGTELAYELRRTVDSLQNSMRDPVTVTATATNTTDEDSITATVLLAKATAAVLADFDVFAVNGQAVVQWRTSAEMGTVGYDLWRWTAGETKYKRVNLSLVEGMRHIQGGTYRLVDHDVSVGESVVYVLYEHDVWGTGNTFGPFEVTIVERGSSTKVAEALATGVAREVNRSSVRVPAPKSLVNGGTPSGMVKVMVRDDGLVRLSAEALASAMGTNPGEVSNWIATGNLWIGTGSDAGPVDSIIFADGFESSDISRWGAGDEMPDEEDGVAWLALANNEGLVFWGDAIDSIYARDNVYWLGVGPGLRMQTRPAAATQTKSLGSFPESLHFEEEQWPLTSVMTDPEADFWMWDYFFPYDAEPSVTKSFTLATPGIAPTGGTAQLVVDLQGSYIADVQENHAVTLRLNGNDLPGPWKWTGHDRLVIDVMFPQDFLNDGDNVVEVTATLVDGQEFDEFYIDSFDLIYQRLHVAEGDHLRATSGGATAVTVTGFSGDEILVFDLANSRKPVLLTGVLVEAESGGFSANFAAAGALMPFVATTPAAVMEPAALVVDSTSNLRDPHNQGRYVIIAGPGMAAEAGGFAAYRTAQGLTAVVARVDDIYDEFSGGVQTPWAIRDFLRYASENWADPPHYVFLAGDGTLDYKGVWGDGENMIPAPLTVADGGLVPSDNLLADWLGEDGVPEVAVGRLPAQSAAELAIYLEKIIAFEAGSGDWKRRALWLADAVDEGGEFSEDLQTLVNDMPAGYTNERIVVDWLGAVEARSRTLHSWNNGALMVHFLGHGALDFIANSGVVTTDDVAGMVNGERAPLLAALTCMVGRFDIPDYDILSEALLLKDAGGSIGVWSPSAFSMNEDAALLGGYQIEAMTSGQHHTIGDTVRAALTAYAAGGLGDPNVPRIFIYLGDPAVSVDW